MTASKMLSLVVPCEHRFAGSDDAGQVDKSPGPVRWMLRLEDLSGLDGAVAAIEPTIRATFASGVRGQVLRGDWIGHALHPALANFVLGSWTSATLLDVVGDRARVRAAQQLVGAGRPPWDRLLGRGGHSGRRRGRVTSGWVSSTPWPTVFAIGLYAASYVSRRRGSGAVGTRLGLAGVAAAGIAAYLGGHLSTARNVGTRDPAFLHSGDGDRP